MNLITTVIGFAMSATFIVFVCARLICGRCRRQESRQLLGVDSGMDIERQEHRIPGLEPVLFAAIPTMKFNQEAFSSMEDAMCTICLGEYQEKEVLRIMPKCGHSFHLSCIDVWLRKQSTCPVCRLSVHEVFEMKNLRPAARTIPVPSINNPGTLIEHSRQWYLPNTEHSDLGQGSTPVHIESVPEEAEAR